MTTLSTAHHTIVVKRTYDASPARVFAAWRDPLALQKWYVPGDSTWQSRVVVHDFRVGGLKQIEFGPRGEPPFTEDCRYEDIVPDQRVCFSMTIARSAQRITTSMVTVLCVAAGRRTELAVTDQLVILDGGDTRDDRERGWGETLDKLPGAL
jgi:uncharacterized protein YndB with AHSA1/START domain